MLRSSAIRGSAPEFVSADAAMYRVPDDVTIPFGGEVLRAALARVLESFDHLAACELLCEPTKARARRVDGTFRDAGRLWVSWRPGTQWHRTQLVGPYDVEPQRRRDTRI
jgi:hypothetical protein